MNLLNSNSTEHSLADIHRKVDQLCRLCDIVTIPLADYTNQQQLLHRILNDLGKTINCVTATRGLENEYKKLEEAIQKKEGDIRKHIGLEQQLKLYSQSLEQQLDESEVSRSQLLEKCRKMLSEIKRDNHFLHDQNRQLREQISLCFEDSKTRKKTFNIDVDLRKHMRTESSKDHLQKTPSRHKFTQGCAYKKSQLIRTKMDMREALSSAERDREIQKKIKHLNHKSTIEDTKHERLNNNSSYHELYSRNVVDLRRDNLRKKPQPRGSLQKNYSSKRGGHPGDDQTNCGNQKGRSIHK